MKLPIVVQVNSGKKQAFVAGFWKGLGAPAVLFGDQVSDPDICDFKPRPLPKRNKGTASDDWKVVGADLRNAIEAQ